MVTAGGLSYATFLVQKRNDKAARLRALQVSSRRNYPERGTGLSVLWQGRGPFFVHKNK